MVSYLTTVTKHEVSQSWQSIQSKQPGTDMSICKITDQTRQNITNQ